MKKLLIEEKELQIEDMIVDEVVKEVAAVTTTTITIIVEVVVGLTAMTFKESRMTRMILITHLVTH
jgi:hypothetical protein